MTPTPTPAPLVPEIWWAAVVNGTSIVSVFSTEASAKQWIRYGCPDGAVIPVSVADLADVRRLVEFAQAEPTPSMHMKVMSGGLCCCDGCCKERAFTPFISLLEKHDAT